MGKKIPDGFNFRVVAGTLKGRIISTPDLGITRPPLTRLRKAIFDFLAPYISDSDYLDLFCGTGSYLFEAISRRAQSATGIELNGILAGAINREAERFSVSDRLFCHCEDVMDAIPRLYQLKKKFDIIMIAPPQYQGLMDQTLNCLHENRIFGKDSLIICQHDTSETHKIDFLGFPITQTRKYGNTTFTLLTGDIPK